MINMSRCVLARFPGNRDGKGEMVWLENISFLHFSHLCTIFACLHLHIIVVISKNKIKSNLEGIFHLVTRRFKLLPSLTEVLPFLLLLRNVFVWNTEFAGVNGRQTTPKKLSADALKSSKITDQSVPSSLTFVCPCLCQVIFCSTHVQDEKYK